MYRVEKIMIAYDFCGGRALKIAIISLILLSITVNAEDNISQGFQRLNDVYLNNDTNMAPRFILEHILATQTQQDITFTGNFRQLWNYSAGNSNITYGQVVEDLDGDGLDDILIATYGIESGIYYYTVQAKKGKDGNILWQKSISGTNTWIYVHPAGDLNGDGLNDVYMTITDNSQSPYISTVQVMKGNNGGILWQENANGQINVLSLGEYWDFSLTEYPVGDLDGDGINDVLLQISDTYGDTLKAKKGINGKDLWQESVINGAITSYPAGDLNGDGTNDVLLNIYDRNVNTHTVKAKKGIDGQDLWQETGNWIGSIITGDMDGDGLNDILLHRSVSNAFILEVKKGIDGNDLWTDNNGFAMPAKDLNGDGLVDLLIYSYDNNLLKATLKAKKGIDGQNLWQEICDVIDYEFYPIEDLNGDGMNDVLLGVYDNNLSALKAKKGIDGQDLWQTDTHPITIDAVGDLNGDGTNDIVQRIEAYPCDDGPCILKATKGIDGQDLWQEIVANGNGEINYLYNAGDLNGDNLNDLVEAINDWNNGTYILKAKNGKYGIDIWSAESSTLDTAKHISDLDGDGLNDFLLWSNDKMYLVSSTPTTRFIKGTVMDSVNKTALSGVTVSTNTNLSTKTDATGFYSFAVTEGAYNLTAKLEPTYYANNTITVSTIESDVVQDIELLNKPTGTITGMVTGTPGGITAISPK
jgi:FG-GAP-like repeat